LRYVKHKREKVGECTICRGVGELTWDHIPPQVAGNVDPVMLVSAMTAISGHAQEDRPLISQNGYKIRSICKACNETIGQEYDPTIGALCASITRYLESPLTLLSAASFDTVPARLLRGLLAHILSAKLSPTTGIVDQDIREYPGRPHAEPQPRLAPILLALPARLDFYPSRLCDDGADTQWAGGCFL
jgi:hypothetical protein